MFEGLFQPMHLLVIFGLALLVFGPKKLPELGKGLGQSIRGFKSAIKAEDEKPTPRLASSDSDSASKDQRNDAIHFTSDPSDDRNRDLSPTEENGNEEVAQKA